MQCKRSQASDASENDAAEWQQHCNLLFSARRIAHIAYLSILHALL